MSDSRGMTGVSSLSVWEIEPEPIPGRLRIGADFYDEPVPRYEAENAHTATALKERFRELAAQTDQDAELPLSGYPTRPPILVALYKVDPEDEINQAKVGKAPLSFRDTAYTVATEFYELRCLIVDVFFAHLRGGRAEGVREFVREGLVTANCRDKNGTTALIAAVESGSVAFVRMVMEMGAQVDGMGSTTAAPLRFGREPTPVERTALQVAAARGMLAVVKLLREDFSADDGVIAPDGALALRLAASHRHVDVVRYLPSRRGGEWKRWKTEHARQMRVVKRAGKGIYEFFRFIFWSVPRGLVYDLPRIVGKHLWKRKGAYYRWVKRQVVAMPGRVVRGAKAAGRAVAKVPGKVSRAVQKLPRLAERMGKLIWRAIRAVGKVAWKILKALPKLAKTVADWAYSGAKKVTKAVVDAVAQLLSLMHTLVHAVLSFFQRITLKDVYNGLVGFLKAACVTVPQTLWKVAKVLAKGLGKLLVGLLGSVGGLIYCVFYALFWVVRFVPVRLWRMVVAMGKSVARGGEELMVWVNPKFGT